MSARRMNDLWGRMSLALLLCALLLNGGLCQDDDAAAPSDPPRGDDVATAAPDGDPQTPIEISAPTDLPAPADPDNTDGTSATAAPDATDNGPADTDATDAPDATSAPGGDEQATQGAPVTSSDLQIIMSSELEAILSGDNPVTQAPAIVATEDPEPISVKCVSQDEVKDTPVVKIELASPTDCEAIKAVVEEEICKGREVCKIFIAQEGEMVTLSGKTVEENVGEVLQSLTEGQLKEKLGVLEATPVAKKSSNVLVAILVTGLLLAAALIAGYIWLNRRRGNGKGMRLAEDSYPVDEENQGNTLVSVAPLNPPEPQEKPSINGGEAPADGVKTQAPAATNGHSTAKTPVADTEL